MSSLTPIETARLHLRPFRPDDLEAFHAIWGDPEVIWWGAHKSLDATRAAFETLLARHAGWPPEIGWYALRERVSGEVLGDVLLQPARFVDGIEIGWHLRRSAWGRGLATEAAAAVRDHAFEAAGLERLYAIVALQNERSLRVVEKVGFQPLRDQEYAGWPHRLFAIDPPPV